MFMKKYFLLITFLLLSQLSFAQADLPLNLSLKGIGDWTRNFQYVMSGTSGSLPAIAAKGIHYIEWSENNFPAHYISNGASWVLQVGRLFNKGTVSAPGIAFVNDKDTGIFSDSDGVISFSSNNTNIVNIKNNEIEFLKGLRLGGSLITAWPTGGGGGGIPDPATINNLTVVVSLKIPLTEPPVLEDGMIWIGNVEP